MSEHFPVSIMTLCFVSVLFLLPMILLATAIRVVPEYQRLSIFRLGRYLGEKGPGLIILLPFIDRAVPMDIRDQVKKAMEMSNLWGAIGETATPVHSDGSVVISGETWNAVSKTPIPQGARIRVTRVLLEIEQI